MTQPFFIEVGCEEIPARFLVQRLDTALGGQLFLTLSSELRSSGLSIDDADLHAAYTPRRLAAWTDKILERQSDREEETVGPPVKAAYDAQGSPTPAAVNFAKKFGVAVGDLYKVTTPRGEYIAARRKIAGQAAAELLPGIILRAWNRLELPRSMKWDESGFKFIRPVRWLVVLLGDEVIPMQLGDVPSGRQTRGHRTLGSQAIELKRADGKEYLRLLEENFVLARPEARRERIRSGLREQTPEKDLRAVKDAELLEILVNLTEYPTVIRGEFDRQFLELPREVLVTVMRNHQRYFALEKAPIGANINQLAPGFLAVANQDQDRDGLIRQGHERVLRARFNDALFFWRHDRKRKLSDRLEDLKHITFHAKLGSYYDKTQRMKSLVDPLCEALKITEHQGVVRAAVQLAKCDLSTDLVKEFTELQGQIGGRLMQVGNYIDLVWPAIYDHYLPLGSEDKIPRNLIGAAVALADKFDTLAGMFAIGEIPSGSRDPYALRRAGNGIVRILVDKQISMPLNNVLKIALEPFQNTEEQFQNTDHALRQLRLFFKERQEFFFQEMFSYKQNSPIQKEEVMAVLNPLGEDDPFGPSDDPFDVSLRLRALNEVRRDDPQTFARAAEVFKRMRNIVQKEGELKNRPDRSFDHKPFNDLEKELCGKLDLLDLPEKSQSPDYYREYLSIAADMASLVEKYFNEVRVNDPDPVLRKNRLEFLNWATVKLGRVADLSLLSPLEK